MLRSRLDFGTLVTAAMMLACGGGDGSGRRFLSLGTAGTGGIYYPLGGAIAARLSEIDSVRQYTAEVTGGSVENLNRVSAGEMDLAFSIGTSVYEAFNGGEDFQMPMSDLRVVAPLYPNVTHVLIARGAGMTGIEAFRGRRISVGAPGSGTEQVSRHLLEIYGVGYDDIDIRYLSFRESADALRDGAIAAAILSVGYPASSVLEVTTSGGVRLLGIGRAQRDSLTARYPYYDVATIPAGSYPGVDADIPTVAVMNWVVARADLPAEVVEHVLQVLDRDRDRLIQVHDIARQIRLEALDRPPIPLHDAAQRWWNQRGQAHREGGPN